MLGRRSLTLLFALAAALVAVAPALAGGKPDSPGAKAEPPTDQIVIRMAPGATLDATALDATAGVDLKQLRKLADGSYVLKLGKRHDLDAVRAITDKLAARSDVASAEPDAMMEPFSEPADPLWGQQWDLFDPAGGANFGANLPGAWDITQGDLGVTIGVIDTGYRPHLDLTGRISGGADFISDAQIANDGGGRDDIALDPGDWITPAENASGFFAGCGTSNSSWHGTHVAGTIGAVANNGQGLAGINRFSQIVPLRVLGKCGGYTSDIADAIRWAAGYTVSGIQTTLPKRLDVVNLSLGGSGTCSATYQSAINAAVQRGTVVVVAAGNSNANAANYQPASCAGVITVAATGHTGRRAYYSNYGSTVEIAAPGGDAQLGQTILSTLNTGTQAPVDSPAGDTYVKYQGTSMATPHVVGVVSLMRSVNPDLTPAEVTAMLQANVTPFPAGSTCTPTTCGPGILNAGKAVAAAFASAHPSPPGVFAKTAPADQGHVVGTSATLKWNASSGASGYAYCLDTSPDGMCGGWVSTGAATSATVTVAAGNVYSWQVRATNGVGQTLADGGAWYSFTADAAPASPGAFSKTSPTNGTTNAARPVTITWGVSSAATSYEWCVSTTSNSCSGWTSTGSTSASLANLKARKTYYWQVRATNTTATTNANDSTWWSFKTK